MATIDPGPNENLSFPRVPLRDSAEVFLFSPGGIVSRTDYFLTPETIRKL